ncbi:MAG: PA4642 family protein [Alcanivorax sediminis]|uniref:PA4642 family protein n=1 Tax=Alcanivorax sediminis TaxID=2663008 RepID=UPI003C569FA4
MAERKDKKKVIGEPMTDEQIQVFLNFSGEEGVSTDFHILEKAYRALRAEDFERFIVFFKEQGRDLNAQDPSGRTLLSHIEGHAKSDDYADVLRAAGGHA